MLLASVMHGSFSNLKNNPIAVKITRNSVISASLYALLVAILMGLEEFYEGQMSATTVVEEILAYLSILAILFFCIVVPFQKLIAKLNARFSWRGHFIQRIGLEGIIVIVLSIVLGIVFGNFIHIYIDHTLPTISVIFRTVLFLLITSTIIMAILELQHLSDEKEELVQFTQQLEKEKIETLYNALKQQVNPHFLFNSLSVLSTLVHVDVKKADLFIQHFADIYRYVLDINDRDLVTLQQELNFLEAYLYLQRIRFGDYIQLNNKIADKDHHLLLPPLSLQMVFENILKHNIISKGRPIKIHMVVDQRQLVVENTLQPRADAESTGIGIKNLKAKYHLLNHESPVFQESANKYTVWLPLFQTEVLSE